MVTAKDIEYLLRGLFGDDWQDYRHERARVQIGSALAMFAGLGTRAGAVVELSSYRDTNECLSYRVRFDISKIEANHIVFENIPFSLGSTIFNALKALAVEVNEKALSLTYTVDNSVPDGIDL